MKKKFETLINQLNDIDAKFSALESIKEFQSLPDELIGPLIKAGINERDPSVNGYFLKPVLNHITLVEIRSLILEFYFDGNFREKVGALKLLYHVHKERLCFSKELNRFVEIEDVKSENRLELKQRGEILIPEYRKCDNLILKYFFQWALPGEKWIREEQPETLDDLWNQIKNSKEFAKMFVEIYPGYSR